MSETAADGSRTQLAYNGLTTSVTSARGQTTTRLRNRPGQVVLLWSWAPSGT